ncbi:MAG: HAMP domain-containing protein [Nitrospirota bacterium]
MNYKLDRRLLAWWFAAVLVIICTHLTLDYLGFETQYKVMLASAITASVLMLPYFFMRKRVMEPLKELRDTAYRIIAGDLSARSAITSPNEFRELSETINAMVAKLSTAYGQLEKANAALEETVRERTAALTIEHEKLAAIFKSIPDGVIFVSITGEILEINPVMEEIWGVKAEELKGRTVAELPEGLLKDSLLPKCGDPNHHRRCWEVFDCVHKNCPAFMSEDLRCWLISGTFCHSEVQVSVKKKLEDVCSKCIVYKDVMEHCGEVIEMEIKGRQYKISSSLVLNLDQKVIGEVKTFYDVTQEKLLEKRKADFVSLITKTSTWAP